MIPMKQKGGASPPHPPPHPWAITPKRIQLCPSHVEPLEVAHFAVLAGGRGGESRQRKRIFEAVSAVVIPFSAYVVYFLLDVLSDFFFGFLFFPPCLCVTFIYKTCWLIFWWPSFFNHHFNRGQAGPGFSFFRGGAVRVVFFFFFGF